jgi:sterol 3beta-glucosyltransferase
LEGQQMKITISTVGSRGDVQPYIALGRGLSKAGHTVTLAVDRIFESFVQENGLKYAYLSADPLKALEVDIRALGNNPIKVFRWMANIVEQIGSEFTETFLQANQGADLMIFSSLAAMVGVHVGAVLNLPMFASVLQPVVPTRAYPYSAGAILPDWLPLRGFINRQSYIFYNRFLYRLFYQMINRDRERVLNLPQLSWKAYVNLDLSQYPILHGFSRYVIPFPPDYDQNQIFTGYWFLDQQEDWQPSPELETFLSREPKPVYIGFGSMVDKEADDLTRLVVDSLRISKQRAVLLGGWTDLGGSGLPENILKVDHVPHDWLFPRVAAAVHHGGAGTTAASLRAGTPTVVVPFFADQPFWGWRVEKLGVGPKPIPRLKLTADKLAAAITRAVQDEGIRLRAAQLGQKIRAEDGVGNAVRAVEEIMSTQRDKIMPTPELLGKDSSIKLL